MHEVQYLGPIRINTRGDEAVAKSHVSAVRARFAVLSNRANISELDFMSDRLELPEGAYAELTINTGMYSALITTKHVENPPPDHLHGMRFYPVSSVDMNGYEPYFYLGGQIPRYSPEVRSSVYTEEGNFPRIQHEQEAIRTKEGHLLPTVGTILYKTKNGDAWVFTINRERYFFTFNPLKSIWRNGVYVCEFFGPPIHGLSIFEGFIYTLSSTVYRRPVRDSYPNDGLFHAIANPLGWEYVGNLTPTEGVLVGVCSANTDGSKAVVMTGIRNSSYNGVTVNSLGVYMDITLSPFSAVEIAPYGPVERFNSTVKVPASTGGSYTTKRKAATTFIEDFHEHNGDEYLTSSLTTQNIRYSLDLEGFGNVPPYLLAVDYLNDVLVFAEFRGDYTYASGFALTQSYASTKTLISHDSHNYSTVEDMVQTGYRYSNTHSKYTLTINGVDYEVKQEDYDYAFTGVTDLELTDYRTVFDIASTYDVYEKAEHTTDFGTDLSLSIIHMDLRTGELIALVETGRGLEKRTILRDMKRNIDLDTVYDPETTAAVPFYVGEGYIEYIGFVSTRELQQAPYNVADVDTTEVYNFGRDSVLLSNIWRGFNKSTTGGGYPTYVQVYTGYYEDIIVVYPKYSYATGIEAFPGQRGDYKIYSSVYGDNIAGRFGTIPADFTLTNPFPV